MVRKMNNEPYPTNLSWKPGQKLQPSLDKLLWDKNYLAAFSSFLQTEFSEENVDFWLACEDFKKTISLDELQDKAQRIYREFLEPTAKREVNVDHHIREKIRASLEKPSVSSFDEAQRHIYLLMEKDSWPRFLQSEIYLSLKNTSRTQWYI